MRLKRAYRKTQPLEADPDRLVTLIDNTIIFYNIILPSNRLALGPACQESYSRDYSSTVVYLKEGRTADVGAVVTADPEDGIKKAIEDFLNYLAGVRNFSGNTVAAYRRDLANFSDFLSRAGIDDL